jgi:polar amino acid transport system permease protein
MSAVFDPAFVLKILPALTKAGWVALQVTGASFVLAAAGGLLLLAARRSRWQVARLAATGFVDLFRSTPLLVHIYFFFAVLPHYGLTLSPFWTGVLALSVHNACYMCEIYRSALESVPRAQWETAQALNLPRVDTWRLVVLPQMLPQLVPTLGSFFIYTLKDSPLLAAISVAELMFVANSISADTFRYFEPVTLVGLAFLTASVLAGVVIRAIERSVGRQWREAGR